nr:Chain C, XIP signaling peptide [Streptococcus vestibularis F0396]6HUA_D Chain D, XIP signaling peptide [Streptococcus vestibularis F0396]
VPFFMIYY